MASSSCCNGFCILLSSGHVLHTTKRLYEIGLRPEKEVMSYLPQRHTPLEDIRRTSSFSGHGSEHSYDGKSIDARTQQHLSAS